MSKLPAHLPAIVGAYFAHHMAPSNAGNSTRSTMCQSASIDAMLLSDDDDDKDGRV